jgi:hypothetical protein
VGGKITNQGAASGEPRAREGCRGVRPS